MTAQLLAVYVLIAVAVFAVSRGTLRTWLGTSKAGCGSGCGKCAAPAHAPQPLAVRRAR